jgi:hypothetical protein
MKPSNKLIKRNGVVYTPRLLADHVAQKALYYYLLGETSSRNNNTALSQLRVLDPACGKGELLTAFWRACTNKDIVGNIRVSSKFNPIDTLCGIDIDKTSAAYTQNEIRKILLGKQPTKPIKTLTFNTLLLPSKKSFDSIKTRFDATKGFDVIIANPPWGADISSFKSGLDNSAFSLLQGQFDTSDLFFELSLKLGKPGGILAFIIPDSLFALERRALRKLISTQTQILYLARLGEGFFPDVFRGCAVLIVRNAIPTADSNVECMRLNPQLRSDLLASNISFADAENQINHFVPQSRFINDREYIFDIDTTVKEEKLINKIGNTKNLISNALDSSRGVELSKRGSITQCPSCLKWSPTPTHIEKKCQKCGKLIDLTETKTVRIINNEPIKGYLPIVVGECISRYQVEKYLFIDPSKKGVNYKNLDQYSCPKIVVRKTGVGLTASIDYSGALTNQVVYSFVLKHQNGNVQLPLELYLAILNSRLMYYYIIKRFGEIEWRSHPYLTLKHIRELPLPDKLYEKIDYISESAAVLNDLRKSLISGKKISNLLDARIENLVANLYGLHVSDYNIIYSTLSTIEKLRPVRLLLNITPKDIFNFKYEGN